MFTVVFLLLSFMTLCSTTFVKADISGLALTVEYDGMDDNASLNSLGEVNLRATWSGDTPAYTATFRSSSGATKQDTTTAEQSSVVMRGGELGDGTHTFEVTVIESSVANPVPANTSGNRNVTVVLTSPGITVSLNNDTFSNQQGSNQVEITVTSTRPIRAPQPNTDVVVEPSTHNATIAADSGNEDGMTTFRYTMTLDTAVSGTYTVRATGRDMTLPPAGANQGQGQRTFTVTSAGPGAGTIESVDPGTPTNVRTITLSGSISSSMDASRGVEVLAGGETWTGTVSGNTWTANIPNLDEGEYSFRMRGFDNLGNPSNESAPFNVTIDITPPDTPVLDTNVTSPTNASSVILSGTGAVDGGSVTSPPITVKIFDQNGAEVASTNAAADGSFSATVPLVVGHNQFYAIAYDSTVPGDGNNSGVSNRVNIYKDDQPSTVDATFISRPADGMASMPVPLSSNYQLGAGTYYIQVNFGKDMNISERPNIDINTAGGTTLSSSGGRWVASSSYVGNFSIPQNGGGSVDGVASVRVSNAKDAAGNEIGDHNVGNALVIDSTPPITSFNTYDDIFVASDTQEVRLQGTVEDLPSNGSGVGHVEIVWQKVDDPSIIGSETVPIMAASPSPWNFYWDPVNDHNLGEGTYRVWAISSDRAQPVPNMESRTGKDFRTVIIAMGRPIVTRISIGNMADDINALPEQPPAFSERIDRLRAIVQDVGGSGIAFNSPNFDFSLQHDDSGTNILGNYTNNGEDSIVFDFPELTLNGTYTVSVTPVDKAGNMGITATRSFIINRDAPDDITVFPPDRSIANKTHAALSNNQVWVEINDPRADYDNSTIEVRYNGNLVGEQVATEGKLVWQLHGADGLAIDQSHDGRYDVTVVARDTLGNVSAPLRTYFYYDNTPPVITEFVPEKDSLTSDPVWFGRSQNQIALSVSDAPRDIIEHADKMGNYQFDDGSLYRDFQIPGDPNWYNGGGSGFDISNSSFTYTFEGEESDAAQAHGNTMILGVPTPPQADDPATLPGVGEVRVEFTLRDRVNQGDDVPNSISSSYSYMFDYLPPRITNISVPDPNNNKFCKNVLPIEGTAEDIGTSDDLEVVAIEWSWPNEAWQEVDASGLPAKVATFSAQIDIADLDDGTHMVLIRARDKGGNYSEVREVLFEVKRTPPEPPELVTPLPNTLSNRRGQMFRWNTSTHANKYLLQIGDDPSFNNVVNEQHLSDYPDLKGQIAIMTENAYSLPSDGDFFWRVAAIEDCADGYLISQYSATRKITIDTVRPRVVSVEPSPSSSNKITTGMVTFTIRFSENIDTTAPLDVRLTSHGGEVMKVEKTKASNDTWIGTTVIPKNESALYDGPAILSIQGATDLAGNIMEPDSSNTVIINTGPAFQTRIFSNPANPYEIMIVVRASEALNAPPTCSVQQSSKKTPVAMHFLRDRYYAGSYKIDVSLPGRAYIDISGQDLHGMTGFGYVEFTVADLSASQRLNLTSISGQSELKGAENSAFGNASIYMIEQDLLEEPFASNIRASSIPGVEQVMPVNGAELIAVRSLEYFGPADLRLRRRLLYNTKIDSTDLELPVDKIHLYRLNSDGHWVFQGGEIKEDSLSAQLTGLGRLALMADLTPPSLEDLTPSDNEMLEDPTPEIRGKVLDYGSGVDRGSFRMFINDQQVQSAALARDGSFRYQVAQPLPRGRHEVRFEAQDLAGNMMSETIRMQAPGPFEVEEFMPYPNPATGNRMHFNYNFNQAADNVRLRLYDSAGHLVKTFDNFDFANPVSGQVRWDLRNNRGRRVANGVYFYRLQITRNGHTRNKRGSLAVAR